jgi:hypothetical protein
VFGSLAAFGGWEGAVGVDFAFEAFEELVSTGLGAGSAVGGLGPGRVCGDLLVDVRQVEPPFRGPPRRIAAARCRG